MIQICFGHDPDIIYTSRQKHNRFYSIDPGITKLHLHFMTHDRSLARIIHAKKNFRDRRLEIPADCPSPEAPPGTDRTSFGEARSGCGFRPAKRVALPEPPGRPGKSNGRVAKNRSRQRRTCSWRLHAGLGRNGGGNAAGGRGRPPASRIRATPAPYFPAVTGGVCRPLQPVDSSGKSVTIRALRDERTNALTFVTVLE